jgi:hypothetical protein
VVASGVCREIALPPESRNLGVGGDQARLGGRVPTGVQMRIAGYDDGAINPRGD